MADKKTINYIGYYALQGDDDRADRLHFASAVRKMDYLCEALIEAGFRVNIISPSWSQAGRGFFKSKRVAVNEDKEVLFFPSFGTKSKVLKRMRMYLSDLWLAIWLISHVKRQEKVIVYHSLLLIGALLFAKLIKNFKIIMEVEEIYSDVLQRNAKKEKLENKMLSAADAFIFSTGLLERRVDLKDRAYMTVYGEYKMHPRSGYPGNDGKIHVVYAGLIDTQITSGAFIALDSVRYLDGGYVMHFLGYGSEKDIALLNKQIIEVNSLNGCRVVFDGLKEGQDCVNYMHKCHIGLSTRKAGEKYLQTSFPSKILSYLSCSLRVISCDIESVRASRFGGIINYYSEAGPQSIAETIRGIDINEAFNPEPVLTDAHGGVVLDLKKLLSPETNKAIIFEKDGST